MRHENWTAVVPASPRAARAHPTPVPRVKRAVDSGSTLGLAGDEGQRNARRLAIYPLSSSSCSRGLSTGCRYRTRYPPPTAARPLRPLRLCLSVASQAGLTPSALAQVRQVSAQRSSSPAKLTTEPPATPAVRPRRAASRLFSCEVRRHCEASLCSPLDAVLCSTPALLQHDPHSC